MSDQRRRQDGRRRARCRLGRLRLFGGNRWQTQHLR
jgi:hypothetical protein